MRVAHFLSSTAFHGAEAMAAELVRQLAGLGVENHVLLLDNAGKADRQVLVETVGYRAGSSMIACDGALDRQTFKALGAYLAAHDIDVVHSHKYKTSFYALPVCRWQNRAVLSTYHNWIGGSNTLRAYNRLDKNLARFNHMAVGVSTPVMGVLQQHVALERCRQIDNGIDTRRFRPPTDRLAAKRALGISDETVVLGCVGRLSAEKGVGRLLDALGVADADSRAEERATTRAHGHSDARPDWLLLLVGDGDLREDLQAQARALGLAERVRFLGHRSDTAALYRAMDVYLLPSLLEAFPMALLEAMASGCAVMAADVGEVARMLDGGGAGQVVAGAGPAPWTSALRPLLVGLPGVRDELAGLAVAARSRVEALYSAQAMARNYLQAYQAALRNSGRGDLAA
jgi:glycosyltransferase involved in cell wall biosynthesis